MTMGSKSATATPAKAASATNENFMVKIGFRFADVIPQRFIASGYSWDNWIERKQREEVKRGNSEMRELKPKMGDPWTSNPLIVRSNINSVR